MEKSLWQAHLNVCMRVYVGLCGWEGHTFPPMTKQNRCKEVTDRSSPCIRGEEGRKSIHLGSRILLGFLYLASPALCQSPLRSMGSVFQRNCLGHHFHLYAVESSLSNLLLLLNPRGAACKFKDFQPPTETPTPTPRTQ